MVIGLLLQVGYRTVKAAGKTALGKGTLAENFSLEFKGMGPLEARLVESTLGEDGEGPTIKAIEVKGLFPVSYTRNLAFITSIFDEIDGEKKAVLSSVEIFQEDENIVFQHKMKMGRVSPDQGYAGWSRVGVVIPEIIRPPVGGARNFTVFIRLVDLDNMPIIQHGFGSSKGPSALWSASLEFSWVIDEKGYEEEVEDRDHARALSVKIGMAVAMADGTLDDTEGETLKAFVKKSIAPFSDQRKKTLKAVYNDAMKVAHAAAQTGDLSLSDLTKELNEVADKSSKYETMELCFEVMAADGVADAEELKIIRKVSEALELDFDEIEKMRDNKIVGLKTNLGKQASIEDILGIEADWDETKIKKHLLAEFQKWNNRLNTLAEGDERTNAQQMLDLVAEARKKYD